MSKQETPYNQIDFVIKAPRFRIVFSYMSNQNSTFAREYLLRLLHLTPCKPEQIAQYFGFNQHETEVALADLERNKWISWQENGMISLSAEGIQLFHGDDSPQIPKLVEHGGEYYMELLDHNFFTKKDSNNIRQQAIELPIEPKILSESTEIAQKIFQTRFRQLQEDEIIQLNDKDIALYKIDAIETKGSPVYFRFTQKFELLPETGEAKERHDVPNLIHQDSIQQVITQQIEKFSRRDNLKELLTSMNQLDDNNTLQILLGGKLDFNEFLKVRNEFYQKNDIYFLGQLYHQEEIFKKINKILKQPNKKSAQTLRALYWLAPSDIYWGKQRKIHDKIQNLINEQKNKGYEFRLYLPLPSERYRHEKQEWEHQFKDLDKKCLFGFCEGFLEGNTEILFLEDEFAAVCYHAKLEAYPVTLPIGFFTTKVNEVRKIAELVRGYLNASLFDENEDKQKDFGLLSQLK